MEGSPLNHHGQTGCSIRQGRLADKVGCFADEPTHFIAIRQTGDLQSRGTGALWVQRDGGERDSENSKGFPRPRERKLLRLNNSFEGFSRMDSGRGATCRHITVQRAIRPTASNGSKTKAAQRNPRVQEGWIRK